MLPLENIFFYFTISNCPSLSGKPKLFFIQACRGERFDSGTLVNSQICDQKINFDYTISDNRNGESFFLIPNEVDFLVHYSTYPGHVSWRNKVDGSWFIQELCHKLNSPINKAKHDVMIKQNMHFVTLLTLVNQNIAFNRKSNGGGDSNDDDNSKGKKQIPCLMSTLTKLIDKLIGNIV